MRAGKSSSFVPEVVNQFRIKKQNIWIVGVDYSKTDRFIFGSGNVKGVLDYIREYLPFLMNFNRHQHKKDHKIENYLGSVIQGKSVKYPDSFVAEPVNLMVLEDAASFPEGFYDKFIRPRVVDTNGVILINSVPPLKKNWFVNLINKADGKRIETIHWNMSDNPNVGRNEIEDLRRDLPKNIARLIVDGELPTDDSSVFGNLQNNLLEYTNLPYKEGHIYQGGVDIGKIYDRTVLTISDLTDNNIAYIDRFPERFFKKELVEARLLHGLELYKFPNTYVDVSGIGEIFRTMVSNHTFFIPFVISSNKVRNNLIEGLAMAFQRGFTVPKLDFLTQELNNLDIVLKSNYHLYKTQSGFHDDCIISIGLSLYGYANKMYNSLKDISQPEEIKGSLIEEDKILGSHNDPIEFDDIEIAV